jgi:formate-dependent nitrite reductase membrane component NrfD
MRRRVHIFLSLATMAGLIIGASAVAKYVYYWNAQDERYTPAWVTYLVVVVVVLAVLSPILTWPRPWRLWRIRG